MSKWKKFYWGGNGAHFQAFLDFGAKQFELIFSKMLKLDEKEYPDPKMSDFEWFGEVFNFSMFNMFSLL